MAQEYVPDSARESLVDIRDVKLDSSMEQADPGQILYPAGEKTPTASRWATLW